MKFRFLKKLTPPKKLPSLKKTPANACKRLQTPANACKRLQTPANAFLYF
jgi:hypothetical protein